VAPTLLRSPEDRMFYSGTVSFIECGVSNKTFPPATVQWYRSDDEIVTSDEEITSDENKFLISPNTNTLLIARTTQTDAATYRCVASNAVNSITSRGGVLTVEPSTDGTYINVRSSQLSINVFL